MNDTIERSGKVVAVSGDGVAQVSLERPTSCAQCGSRGTCGSGAAKQHIVSLRLSAMARVGQEVMVTTSPASVVTAALLGYALPAICLLIGAIAGEITIGSDESAVAGAVIGLMAGFLVARVISGMVLRRALSIHALQERYEHSFQSGEHS